MRDPLETRVEFVADDKNMHVVHFALWEKILTCALLFFPGITAFSMYLPVSEWLMAWLFGTVRPTVYVVPTIAGLILLLATSYIAGRLFDRGRILLSVRRARDNVILFPNKPRT